MDDQSMSTDDLITGIPVWVAMLAVQQCFRAGDHDRDHMGGFCRAHVLAARQSAAWLGGDGSDAKANWDARP